MKAICLNSIGIFYEGHLYPYKRDEGEWSYEPMKIAPYNITEVEPCIERSPYHNITEVEPCIERSPYQYTVACRIDNDMSLFLMQHARHIGSTKQDAVTAIEQMTGLHIVDVDFCIRTECIKAAARFDHYEFKKHFRKFI